MWRICKTTYKGSVCSSQMKLPGVGAGHRIPTKKSFGDPDDIRQYTSQHPIIGPLSSSSPRQCPFAVEMGAFNLQTCARANILKLKPYRCAREYVRHRRCLHTANRPVTTRMTARTYL